MATGVVVPVWGGFRANFGSVAAYLAGSGGL